MNIGKNDTALVLTDPQNDVLIERGVAWPFVGAGIRENRTVENVEQLLRAAGRIRGRNSFLGTSCVLFRPVGWPVSW
jgi:hypothetical protein